MKDERTEKEILSNIEDYTRATMRSTERTAKNIAFIAWITIAGVVICVVSIALSL